MSKSNQVRIHPEVLKVAEAISKQTSVPVGAVISDACREVFSWYLKGASAAVKQLGKELK